MQRRLRRPRSDPPRRCGALGRFEDGVLEAPEQLELSDISLLAPPTRVYRHKTRYDASTRSFDPALFSVVKRMLLADAGFA
jgi:hypothetical protein